MVKYCSKCGNEIENANSKFCPKCGNSLGDFVSEVKEESSIGPGQIKCPFCNKPIPFNSPKCPFCGNLINAKSHTVAIVLGYIFALCGGLIGFIFGIYLVTRDNPDVHKHGLIMIILSIVMALIWLLAL